jgi:NTP pyrophosphatase (non-canonical NTP hydrolase)
VILRRRGRFGDLVARQLDLFAADESALLAEAGEAEAAWNEADRDSAEERYGDLQLVLDAIGDRLLDIRETYAATLDEEAADEYRAVFSRAARKRFGLAAAILAEQ